MPRWYPQRAGLSRQVGGAAHWLAQTDCCPTSRHLGSSPAFQPRTRGPSWEQTGVAVLVDEDLRGPVPALLAGDPTRPRTRCAVLLIPLRLELGAREDWVSVHAPPRERLGVVDSSTGPGRRRWTSWMCGVDDRQRGGHWHSARWGPLRSNKAEIVRIVEG